MTASFLTIRASLRSFTFNSHKSIKHKIQLLLLNKKNTNGQVNTQPSDYSNGLYSFQQILFKSGSYNIQ